MLVAGTAKQVRLESNNDTLVRERLAETEKRRGRFRRMVGVVVKHHHAVLFADKFKAARDSFEFGASLACHIRRNPLFHGERHGGCRVQHVMAAGNLEAEFAKVLAVVQNFKNREALVKAQVVYAVLGLTAKAIRYHRLAHARKNRLHVRVVEAQNSLTVERNLVHELHEGILDFLDVLVGIQVIGIDIGDNGRRRHHRKEATVKFVTFGNQVITAAHLGAAPLALHDTAHNNGRVKACIFPNLAYDRSGRRLTMSTRNRKRVLHTHEFTEHFGAADYRNTAVTGFDKFWIIVRDSRRINHQVGIFDILGFMLRKHLDSKTLKVINHRTFTGIGSAHHKAIRMKHFSNTRHTCATDTHKVEATDTLTIINLH